MTRLPTWLLGLGGFLGAVVLALFGMSRRKPDPLPEVDPEPAEADREAHRVEVERIEESAAVAHAEVEAVLDISDPIERARAAARLDG